MSNFLSNFSKWIKNPVFLMSAFALVWIGVFDNYNFIKRYDDLKSLSKLEEERNYYIEQIREIRKKKKELLTNKATMEKFARETYFMKKDSEDIFIFVEPKE